MLDLERLTDALVSTTRRAIAEEISPLVRRIAEIEKRIDGLPQPVDGKDADPAEIAQIVMREITPEIADLRKAIESIPEAPEVPDAPGLVEKAVAVAKGELHDELAAMIPEIPEPLNGKDGKDGAPGRDGVDGEKGVDGEPGEKGERGEKGDKGDPGTGLAGALIDRDGSLVLTLSNGETQNLGRVVGHDGAPGNDGENGLGFEDMALDYDGERELAFRFERGDRVYERKFTIPCVIYRGVYKDDRSYARGDQVTYGGSQWIANKETSARPDSSRDWTLSVKRGRDGKDGTIKPDKRGEPVQVK